MSDFANDAVFAAMSAEFHRDDHRDQHSRSPHQAFDSGCFDAESLATEYRYLSLLVDGFGAANEVCTIGKLHWTEKLHLESADRLSKYLTTWRMRLGMARQVISGQPLSDKQRKWMNTNWSKGSEDFEKTFTDHPERFVAIKGLELTVKRIEAAHQIGVKK